MKGVEITKLESLDDLSKEKVKSLIEEGLDGKLHEDYFSMAKANEVYLAQEEDGTYVGVLILDKVAEQSKKTGELWYMDKFVVAKKYQRNGVGKALMQEASFNSRKLGWKSRKENPFNAKYDELSDGKMELPDGMTFYHKNVDEAERITLVNYARKKIKTVLR